MQMMSVPAAGVAPVAPTSAPAPSAVPIPSAPAAVATGRAQQGDGGPRAAGALAPPMPVPPSFHKPRAAAGFVKPPATAAEVMSSAAKTQALMKDLLSREADYFDIARHPETGLAFDGVNMDTKTGLVKEIRHWSAASKEALDIGLITKAIEGNPMAVQVVGRGDARMARQRAVDILSRKMASLETFAKERPGYGGMLPWYYVGGKDKPITPTEGWPSSVPALDNGEMAWAMLTAEHVLRRNGFTTVADSYKRYVDRMAEYVMPMFYDEKEGKIRMTVEILDPASPKSGYRQPLGQKPNWISGEHGVHEGMMMVHFATSFGKNVPQAVKDRLWDGIKMNRVEHQDGTTWQAFWGSSHESWQYLFMPMRDDKRYEQLFRTRETIRANNANRRGYGGLATSTNNPDESKGYLSAAGIEGIGTQPVTNNHTFAIYGAFPMLLEESRKPAGAAGNVGVAWMANMLNARDQYGPYGGGESGFNDGTMVAYNKTADGTFTNLLGMMGGVERETADMLKAQGKYGEFMKRLGSEYDETFTGARLRSPSALVAPKTVLP